MIRDVGTGFQVIGLIHTVGIALLFCWGIRFFKTRFNTSGAIAFGASAIIAGVVLFGLFAILTPTSDRGMGILIMLLYPLVDALLVAAGIVAFIVHGIGKAAKHGRKDAPAREGEPAQPSAGEENTPEPCAKE